MRFKKLPLLSLIPLLWIVTSCSKAPQPPQDKFEIPVEAFQRDRMPTCDPHPYIYGVDERGHWMSNGCSLKYINDNTVSSDQPKR